MKRWPARVRRTNFLEHAEKEGRIRTRRPTEQRNQKLKPNRIECSGYVCMCYVSRMVHPHGFTCIRNAFETILVLCFPILSRRIIFILIWFAAHLPRGDQLRASTYHDASFCVLIKFYFEMEMGNCALPLGESATRRPRFYACLTCLRTRTHTNNSHPTTASKKADSM